MSQVSKKINVIFYQILSLGLFFAVMLSIAAFFIFSELRVVWASFLGRLQAVCGCTSHFNYTNHPYLFISLIIAGAGIATFIGYALYRVIKLRKTTDKFVRYSLRNKSVRLSGSLAQVSASIGLKGRIVEVESERPFVFCYGFFHPKICISSVFARDLSPTELKAVLLHEQHHLLVYDPIRIFLIDLVTRIFFFIPGMRILSKKYFTYSEIAADEWSIYKSRGKTALAQAFYKILSWKEQLSTGKASVPFFNQITENRINKIINHNYTLKFRVFSAKFIVTSLFFLTSAFFFGMFIYTSQTAIAEHENASCSESLGDTDGACNMLDNNSVCNMTKDSIPAGDSTCAPLLP